MRDQMVSAIVTIVFALIIVFYAGKLINLSFIEKSAMDEEANNELEIEDVEDGNFEGNEDISDQIYSLEDISGKKTFIVTADH